MDTDRELWQPALAERLSALVEQELEPGERVRWTGQPLVSHFFRRSFPFLLFGLGWTTFAVFLTFAAGQFRVPAFNQFNLLPLIAIPFILIGLAFSSVPLWAVKKAWRTVYVITDRRAILFEGGLRTTTISSYRGDRLQSLRRVQRDDGSGDLIFEQRTWTSAEGQPQQSSSGFFAIPHVKQVEELLREISME